MQDQISRQIATGHYASEDEVLRAALRALTFHHGELAAIRAGIEDMEAGRLRPFDDFDADLRKQFGDTLGSVTRRPVTRISAVPP